jgi:hypothetical protein
VKIPFIGTRALDADMALLDAEEARACEGRWALRWLNSEDTRWKDEFTPKFYYEQTRKEIEREDNITHQRLTWAVAIQAFLMAAVGYLISGIGSQETVYLPMVVYREITLGAIGCIGLASAWITLGGVRASRRHINRVKADWRRYDPRHMIVPELAPHTFGHGPAIAFGSKYAILIPCLMLAAWAFYLAAYAALLGPPLCFNLGEVLKHYPDALLPPHSVPHALF